ncbi:hypothetical protein D779_4068 [Imhoffiella purpurea]|uniref:VapC toxin protein n=1 Tax=Imhoffiella purpurea TaxID=1249627 RepID=W9UYG8_9GAMM|nr:hypothetical protein [Imhoffiella purpurea]EXJ12273.1 hypothetical protein D779_4068 [Imhoffiella purpurea]
MYLLDTNTLIDFFKGRGRVGERLLATIVEEGTWARSRPGTEETNRDM